MLGETFDYTHKDNGFRSQSGLTTHYNTNGISFGMGSIALLDMLAEVASQTLQSDPSMKCSSKATEKELGHKSWQLPKNVSPSKEIIMQKSAKHKIKKPVIDNHKLSVKRKKTGVNSGGKDHRGTINISSLSANGLIKRFSEFDGDEMRRTFTFRCTFDLRHCRQQFSSFGSENKARQHMKDHLSQHVKAMKWEVPSDLPISSKPKAVIEKWTLPVEESIIKKKRKPNNTSTLSSCMLVGLYGNATNNDVVDETMWMQGVAHEEETVSTPGVEDSIAPDLHTPAEEGKNTFVLERKCLSDVGSVVTNQHATEETNNAIVPETCLSEVIVVKLKEEEEEASVYSEHNYMRQENQTVTVDDKLENNICIRVIKEETVVNEFYPYSVKNETKAYDDGMKETASTKSMLFKRLICEDGMTNHHNEGETLHKMVTTFVLNNEEHFQSLPFIGQEVDVNTSQLPDTTSVMSPISIESKVPEHSVFVDVDTEEEGVFATESMSSKIKKNKGNSKLLGQSEAEKNLAIRLIESIKYKGSHPDSLECNICSPTRFFTALTTLISHYRSHAGIKPYECRLCGHVFTRQHSLNYHLLIHGNVTRFECADCGRKFRHPSHFKEHRRRHTGEAPYECLDCPLRFKTRNTYKRHLKTRHGKVLTTSGGLISLSDEEFGQVVTVARNPNLPKKPAPKGQTKQDVEDSNDSTGDGPQNSDQCSKAPGEHIKNPPSQHELDKENAMTNVNNKNGTNKNKSLLSANEAFHDIVEEAMRQSDISFYMEPDNASLTQVTKEPNNNNGFDTSRNVSNNEIVQQNIGGNTLFITKIAQNCNLSSTESTFGTKLKVPSLLSKINSISENVQVLPECSSVYNTLLKQSVTVNVTPVLTGNINTCNASYQRNILPRPRVKPANVSTEFRIICPTAPTTAIMLVTGHPSAKSNG